METWLCLSGGNALGAFHAGAWRGIQDAGLSVTRMAGAPIGAIVAAVMAGNPPDRRVESLYGFWNDISRSALSAAGRESELQDAQGQCDICFDHLFDVFIRV